QPCPGAGREFSGRMVGILCFGLVRVFFRFQQAGRFVVMPDRRVLCSGTGWPRGLEPSAPAAECVLFYQMTKIRVVLVLHRVSGAPRADLLVSRVVAEPGLLAVRVLPHAYHPGARAGVMV